MGRGGAKKAVRDDNSSCTAYCDVDHAIRLGLLEDPPNVRALRLVELLQDLVTEEFRPGDAVSVEDDDRVVTLGFLQEPIEVLPVVLRAGDGVDVLLPDIQVVVLSVLVAGRALRIDAVPVLFGLAGTRDTNEERGGGWLLTGCE